jgi:hypothetical protein
MVPPPSCHDHSDVGQIGIEASHRKGVQDNFPMAGKASPSRPVAPRTNWSRQSTPRR